MKTAVITGAGSGIGRAAALKYARQGYAVALAGRTAETLQKVADEIVKISAPAPLVIPTDASRFPDMAALAQRAKSQWGRIDVWLNNAGSAPSAPLHDLTPERWHDILNSNLSSAFYGTHAAFAVMREQTPKGGTIINISSMAAKDPFPGLGAYAVAKAGVNMLTLVTAREGDPFNICVIAIAPAGVDTPMFRNLVGEANVDTAQLLEPDHVADAILAAAESNLRYASGDTIYLHRRPS